MLEPKRRAAWVRILSAIQTSENMEYQVLDPLLCIFHNNKDALAFLTKQSDDEKRHAELIRQYLLASFAYVKDKPTLSDRVFYALLFPFARRFIFTKAQVAIAIILFYEHFSVGLYQGLLSAAKRDNLSDLSHIIEAILRDEGLHIKGLRELHRSLPTKLSVFDRCLLGFSLKLLSVDVNFASWALHNRSIRRSLQILNIDPDAINGQRQRALHRVTSFIFLQSELP